jgi:hypothetical protein
MMRYLLNDTNSVKAEFTKVKYSDQVSPEEFSRKAMFTRKII